MTIREMQAGGRAVWHRLRRNERMYVEALPFTKLSDALAVIVVELPIEVDKEDMFAASEDDYGLELQFQSNSTVA